MILVDSSVWVGYFNGAVTRETNRLHELLGIEPIAVGDLILAEVLQGFRDDRDFRRARALLARFTACEMLGSARALRVAENYRTLRRRGVTVRKTADAIIATFCIDEGIPLLYSDRDFDPFVRHLGLRAAV